MGEPRENFYQATATLNDALRDRALHVVAEVAELLAEFLPPEQSADAYGTGEAVGELVVRLDLSPADARFLAEALTLPSLFGD